MYHNEIDPYQVDYIRFTADLYVSKLNRMILGNLAEGNKGEVSNLQTDLEETLKYTHELRASLESGDLLTARKEQAVLQLKIDARLCFWTTRESN